MDSGLPLAFHGREAERGLELPSRTDITVSSRLGTPNKQERDWEPEFESFSGQISAVQGHSTQATVNGTLWAGCCTQPGA